MAEQDEAIMRIDLFANSGKGNVLLWLFESAGFWRQFIGDLNVFHHGNH